MRRVVMLAALIVSVSSGALAGQSKDLTRVAVPDEKEAALKAVAEWLQARGIDVETRAAVLVIRKGGVIMNLTPIVHKQELDRLRVSTFYYPKDEFKGTKELEQLAAKLNRAQNFLQVYIDGDGDLSAASNMTFYDELTARHFDAFLDAHAQIVKRWVLTDEALKMLK